MLTPIQGPRVEDIAYCVFWLGEPFPNYIRARSCQLQTRLCSEFRTRHLPRWSLLTINKRPRCGVGEGRGCPTQGTGSPKPWPEFGVTSSASLASVIASRCKNPTPIPEMWRHVTERPANGMIC